MKCSIITCLLLVATALVANAQSESEETNYNDLSEVRKNNFQVDVDLSNILDGLAGAGLVLKKKFDPGKFVSVNSIRLLRASLRMNNTVSFQNYFKDTLANTNYPKTNLDMQIGLGLERQYIHKKFVHYYGIDLIAAHYQSDNVYFGYGGGNVAYFVNYVYKYRRNRIGVNPFFGIKYYLTDRFSLGIETGFELSYYRFKDEEYIRSWNVTQDGKIENYSATKVANTRFSGLTTSFNNVRSVTAGYTF